MKSAFDFRRILNDWLLPVASGLLMMFSFPPWNSGQLAWGSLLPLLFAVQTATVTQAFRRGYVTGLCFFGGTIWWIGHVTIGGTAMLIAFLALYIGGAASWFAWLFDRSRFEGGNAKTDSVPRNLLIALAGAAGWVVLEWMRGWFLMGGFSWNMIGVSQWQAPALFQIAAVTGVFGVSAAIVFINFGFFFTIHRFVRYARRRGRMGRLSWEFYAAMTVLAGMLMHGASVLRQGEAERKTSRTMSVAMIQANIPQSLKFTPGQMSLNVDRHRALTEAALVAAPDLVLWPETSTVDPIAYHGDAYRMVTNLARKANAPMLVGTFDVDGDGDNARWFNAAALVLPTGQVDGVYRKIHLVPFGEYVPWRKALPFMNWFAPSGFDSLERGTELTVFRAGDDEPARFAVVICFEDTIAPLCRRLARQDLDFLVNLTNDAWFKESPAAEMHLANAVFRTVETGRPLIRATNNGVTCIVNRFGGVDKQLEPFTVGFLRHDFQVPPRGSPTFYVQHGDVFVRLCLFVCAVMTLWFRVRRRSQRGDDAETSNGMESA
jgi:apolipoprotein N-acyltransferase